MKKASQKTSLELLREKALKIYEKEGAKKQKLLSEADTLKIIHELEVQQIELEIQNEELLLTKQAFEKSSKRYTELFNFAPSGIFTLSREAKIIEINPSGCDIINYYSKEYPKSFEVFISEKTKPIFRLFLSRIFTNNTLESCEVEIIRKEGAPINVFLNGISQKYHKNCLINAVDISVLKISEARFRDLFSKMKNGVAILKYDESQDDFLITEMNVSGLMILQKTNEQVIQKPFKSCFPGEMSKDLKNIIARVYQTGKPEWLPHLEYKEEKLNLILENKLFLLSENEISYEFEDITQKALAETDLKNSYSQIITLARRTESIREEERKQIAMNLHDDLGQLLTAIKMDITWMKNNLPDKNKKFKKRSESTISIVNQAINSVQRISSELRPPILDNLGLWEAITSHAQDFTVRTNIKTHINLPKKGLDIHADLQTSIYRIIQESFTNIARHSCASRVRLTIRKNINILELEIVDNGVGISEEAIQSSDSLGLIGMWERVLHWQGYFRISGDQGEGTHIEISLPLNS